MSNENSVDVVKTQSGMEVETYTNDGEINLWVGHGGLAGENAILTAQEARAIASMLNKLAAETEAQS